MDIYPYDYNIILTKEEMLLIINSIKKWPYDIVSSIMEQYNKEYHRIVEEQIKNKDKCIWRMWPQ